jgi:penicillin-binding protein 2
LQREVLIRVEFESTTVGRFTELNRITLERQADEWQVAWTPSLIFKDLGADGCVDLDLEPVRRGMILDRDREPLAFDGTIYRVGIVPSDFEPGDEARVLRELSTLTSISTTDLKKVYQGKDPTWFFPIKDFPEQRAEELLTTISKLPGAAVQPALGRVYPLGPAAAHITGYVAEATAEHIEADPRLSPGQQIGQAGVEAGADELLTGTPGGRLIVVQCDTRAERSTIAERPPVPAKDLVLTIDRDLQLAVDAALTAQGDIQGSAVVLDPRTGAVLALVSHPTFDPNGFILGFSTKDWQAINNATRRPLLNRAAQAAYPTGSIFKVITFAAAMKELGYVADTVIDCPSIFQLEGSNQIWEDWTVAEGLGAQGALTLHQALVNSCNTVFYQIGRDLDLTDDTLLPNMARAFGLGAPTDIPYLPEIAGTVPDPQWKFDTFGDYWATGDAVNLAIGQGFLEATPLQMAVAYAAIANGGDLLQPYIVDLALGPGGAGERLGERVVRSRLPLTRAMIREIQSALRDQTSDWNGAGSVRVFGDFPWPIAGKTGTAQNQLDRSRKPHSWFAAFGPYGEEATIASVVMIESVGEGVSFAAPVTRQIYEVYLASDLADG